MDMEALNQPPALKGEVTLLTFLQEDCEVGKLWAKDGKLLFEGDCDASAQKFFDAVVAKEGWGELLSKIHWRAKNTK